MPKKGEQQVLERKQDEVVQEVQGELYVAMGSRSVIRMCLIFSRKWTTHAPMAIFCM